MERAARLARLITIGKRFLSEGGGFLYNRYIRGDDGIYTRVPVDEAPPRPNPPPMDDAGDLLLFLLFYSPGKKPMKSCSSP